MTNRNYLIGFLVLQMALTSLFVNAPLAQDKFHVGQLLVAKPDMPDLRFSETVVFVCRHDAKGALGLVLNRPAGRIKTSKLMESLGLPSDGVTGDVQIRFGGPLETQAGFLMYTKTIQNEDGICSSHGVTVSNNKDVLKTLGSENSPEEFILFFGYAGWSPNQLESELARKDWLTVPADRSFLFAPDIKSLWNRARARYGLDL